MNAVVRVLEWARDPMDDVALALWDAPGAAAAMRGGRQRRFPDLRRRDRFARGGRRRPVRRAEGREHRRPPLRGGRARERGGGGGGRPARSTARMSCVADTTARARGARLRRRARAATRGIIGVTGSVGKTGVKEALFAALDRGSRGQRASLGQELQQPCRRAAEPRADAARARFGVFEMGMNHAGETRRADPRWSARTSRSSPRSRPRTSRSSAARRRSPTPRPRSSRASSRAAPRSSPPTARTASG